MAKNKRLYISLNPEKEKDVIIKEFLESTYNETETIKAILYQHAVEGSRKVHIAPGFDTISSDSMLQRGAESASEEQNDAVSSVEIDNEIMNMFN